MHEQKQTNENELDDFTAAGASQKYRALNTVLTINVCVNAYSYDS